MQATASATAATQAIQQDPALSSEAVQSGQDMFACLVLASRLCTLPGAAQGFC